MHCTRCGRANPANSQFCCNCGSQLVPSHVTRDGNLIVAPSGANFPLRCVKCGKPTVGRPKEYKFAWQPLWVWVFLPILLVFIIVAVIQTRSIRVSFSLCERHKRAYRQLRICGWAALIGGPTLTTLAGIEWGDNGAVLIWLGILIGLGGLASLLLKPIRPTRIEPTYGNFKGAGPGFLAVIPESSAYRQSNVPSTPASIQVPPLSDSSASPDRPSTFSNRPHLASPDPVANTSSSMQSLANERGASAVQTIPADFEVQTVLDVSGPMAVSPDRLGSRPELSSIPIVYGSLGQRFTAYFADLIVIYLIIFVAYFLSGVTGKALPTDDGAYYLVFFIALFSYMIAGQFFYHTTIGKYLHGLEVRSESPNRKYPAFWRILVRETIGRFVASLFWGAGYWFTNRKPKKQAWSDEIAGTIVTVRPTNKALVRAFTAFVLIAFVADVGAIGYGQYKQDRDKRYADLQSQIQSASQDVTAALQTVDNQLNATKPVNNAFDFVAWQDGMKSLTQDLDRYETQIDRMQVLLQRGISEDLTSSVTERTQLIVLKQVYDIRKQQAEKLRQEANLVISSDYSPASMASLRNNLQLLDSDIDALENRAAQLLAQIGEK
jgi:hypothetical protein